MESLQGPINSSSFFGEQHLEVNCLEQSFNFIEHEEEKQFLEMLQIQSTLESQTPQFFPFKDTNFQAVVKLQKPYTQKDDKIEARRRTTREAQIHAPPPEPESCVTTTHDVAAEEEEEKPSPSALLRPENCRRKRKRTRAIKNKEDVENQRMTHIAVERNRRRQMNDHLGVLRSLMPTSYIQRGDQASIIGGAIDYVKELEQLLQSLEAERRMRRNEEEIGLSYDGTTSWCGGELEGNIGEEVKAEEKSEIGDIEVTVIQRHVNLKVECKRRVGQLVKAIVGIEDLRLTILHLNITSSHSTILYSFNLKIEEECKLVSASDIAGAVQEIFRFINGSYI